MRRLWAVISSLISFLCFSFTILLICGYNTTNWTNSSFYTLLWCLYLITVRMKFRWGISQSPASYFVCRLHVCFIPNQNVRCFHDPLCFVFDLFPPVAFVPQSVLKQGYFYPWLDNLHINLSSKRYGIYQHSSECCKLKETKIHISSLPLF